MSGFSASASTLPGLVAFLHLMYLVAMLISSVDDDVEPIERSVYAPLMSDRLIVAYLSKSFPKYSLHLFLRP